MNKRVLSILAFILAAVSVLFLIKYHHLFGTTPFLIALQVAAALLMIWARMTFGLRSFHASASTSEGKLITKGPYRYWRHPIYVSIIYFVWIGQIRNPTLLSLLAAAIVTLALFTRMILEESFLMDTYPEYAEYKKQTKRIIPYIF